jgi:hypothetical protein
MKSAIFLAMFMALPNCLFADDGQPVQLSSPGLAVSTVDATGKLIEDWGSVNIQLSGDEFKDVDVQLQSILLDQLIPAARVVADYGVVSMTRTIYRAPIFPAGVDVMEIELLAADKPVATTMEIATDANVQIQRQTARVGGRAVLTLPTTIADSRPLLDWGYCDDASSLPGWGKPATDCDSAFKNIRAGMGGVPIVYHFSVKPRSEQQVVLGFCESHWTSIGKRPVTCTVEGASPETLDPVQKWGQHQPGGILFQGRDVDGDGKLVIKVRPALHASDRNPILNAIWIFAADREVAVPDVIQGSQNEAADYYVDVGGKQDQSVFPPAKLAFPVSLSAGEKRRWTVLVACPGGSTPLPDKSTWSSRSLLKAACDVWRDTKTALK